MAKKKKAPKPDLSFEEVLSRLTEVVRELEQGNLTLDESLARYEEGIGHLNQCQQKLASAERKIEVLSGFDREGNPVTQRFDDKEMTLEQKADNRSRRRTARPSSKSGETQSSSSEPDDVDVDGTLF